MAHKGFLVVAMEKECALSAYPALHCAHVLSKYFRWCNACKLLNLTDLRWRAVWLVTLRKLTFDEAGAMLFMSGKSVSRFVNAFLTTGNIEPAKQRHGPECFLNEFEQVTVMQILIDNPCVYPREIQRQLYDATGTWVHLSTICRAVHCLGFTRKRLQHIALQRSDDLRAQYMSEISLFDPCTLVWVDESGFRQRNSIRAYGYSLRGLRVIEPRLDIIREHFLHFNSIFHLLTSNYANITENQIDDAIHM